jgi:hypothetical protein
MRSASPNLDPTSTRQDLAPIEEDGSEQDPARDSRTPGRPGVATRSRPVVMRARASDLAEAAFLAATAARLLPVTAQHIAAGMHLLGRDTLVEAR